MLRMLAMDFGAGSGRGIVGTYDGRRLVLDDVSRFRNRPLLDSGRIFWDVHHLKKELDLTVEKCKSLFARIDSVGIDSWGMDFGFIGRDGALLSLPYHYRDPGTEALDDEIHALIPAEEIFYKTGLQPSSVSTLHRLYAISKKEPELLNKAAFLLFIPGLLAYLSAGIISCDDTIASTSHIFDAVNMRWINDFTRRLGIPEVLPDICDRRMLGFGWGDIPVLRVPSHDTACAELAVIGKETGDSVFISCGTWSVVGTDIESPIISADVYENGFCNELGHNGRTMLVKNLTGMWILQECVEEWRQQGKITDYDCIEKAAGGCDFSQAIDTAAPEFSVNGGMSDKVVAYFRDRGIKVPETQGEICMAIFRGLAIKYAETVNLLSRITGAKFRIIRIVGGGARNELLCRLTAEYTGLTVTSGPYEASAVGNLLAQLECLGEISNRNEAEEILKTSFETGNFAP